MKSIQLAYGNIKLQKNLKVKDIVRITNYLGARKFSLSNGDVVSALYTGHYISQIDGYSVYDTLVLWNAADERIEKQIGLIKTR